MERIQPGRNKGLTATGLRVWGMLFVAAGIVGRSILQNRILGLNDPGSPGLLAVLESSPDMMTYATVAIVMQALETCAVPVFAFLLTEGMAHTSDVKRYLMRVLGTAAGAEIPYNLAMSGKLLDFGSRNPVFGLVFAMVVILLCRPYEEKSFKNLLIRLFAVLCGALWCGMLRIEYGGMPVIIAAVLWAFRRKPSYRNVAGAAATVVCSLGSMFFMAAPMGFLAVFLYNGEEGDLDPRVKYAVYPAALLLGWAAGVLLV